MGRIPKYAKKKIKRYDQQIEQVLKEAEDCRHDPIEWYKARSKYNNLVTRRSMEMLRFKKNI